MRLQQERSSHGQVCDGSRDGCHHCGRRSGKVIGDHIPPNKYVGGGGATQRAISEISSSLGISNSKSSPPLGRLR